MADFSEFIDSSFDSELERLIQKKLLSWYPWVGKKYRQSTGRILFILESAYVNENNTETIKSPGFTRQTISEVFINGATYSRTLNNARSSTKSLMGAENISVAAIWERLAYHNMVQRPMDYTGDSTEKPTSADYKRDCLVFLKVLEILKPSLCICMGVTLAQNLLNDAIFTKLITRTKTEPGEIDDVYKLDLFNLEFSGFKTKLIFTAHPASKKGFTPKLWSDYVRKYAPAEIALFKQLSTEQHRINASKRSD